MAARKRVSSRDYTPRGQTQNERPLYTGECVDSLDPPNHLLSLTVGDPDESQVRRYAWPMTSGMHDAAGKKTGVFVHEQHGERHWHEWADHPPTWMDPHLFAGMVEADERVQKILRICYKKKDRHAWKRLLPLFQEIFDEQYLPMMLERFDSIGAPFIAQWVIRHYADKQIQQSIESKDSRRKPRS